MARRPQKQPTGRRPRIALALAAVAVAAAACSSSSSPPRATEKPTPLANAAVRALNSVPYIELNGSISLGGSGKNKTAITVSDVIEHKSASAGTVTVTGNPTDQTGERFTGTVKYVIYNTLTYVYGSAEFWSSLLASAGASATQQYAIVPKLYHRWIELIASSSSNFNAVTAGLVDPRGFAQEFLHTSAPEFSNRGEVTANGASAVQLANGHGGLIDLASTGSPLPVLIAASGNAHIVTSLSYSYPTHATVAPPAHFEYLDTVLKPYLKKS